MIGFVFVKFTGSDDDRPIYIRLDKIVAFQDGRVDIGGPFDYTIGQNAEGILAKLQAAMEFGTDSVFVDLLPGPDLT